MDAAIRIATLVLWAGFVGSVIGMLVRITRRARREPQGARLPAFLSGAFWFALTMWVVIAVLSSVGIARDHGWLGMGWMLSLVGRIAGLVAVATFVGMGFLALEATVERLRSRQRSS